MATLQHTAAVTTYKVHELSKYFSSEGELGERASLKKEERKIAAGAEYISKTKAELR